MRIGPVEIGPGALLAPMEAVTDLPFRTICEEHGAALTFTEFLSAEGSPAGRNGLCSACGPVWVAGASSYRLWAAAPSYWRARLRWRLMPALRS